MDRAHTKGREARAYYNEIDRDAVHVLRSLIADGLIADGDVDDRSIVDVRPEDLAGYTQCHFFAGAGLWSVAARLAGWPDDRPLWTGSCPCQPFSAAGRGLGTDDPRHLWPDFFRLIRECRPPVVFGEQVSAAAGKRTLVDEDMHRMWRGEDLSGFLPHEGISRQFDWLSCQMQNLLPEMAGELSDWLQGAEVGFFPQIPGEEQSFGAGYGRAGSGEAGWLGVRSGRLATAVAGQDRQGLLRDEWAAVSIGWRAHMGQPFTRPDHPGAWLHDHKCAGRSVRPECDDEHMGRGTCAPDRVIGEGREGDGREQSDGALGGATEGEAVLDWLDGVASDLDAIGYAFGSPDIPVCAVDGPHIRQRLYWITVADAASQGRIPAPHARIHRKAQGERPRHGESERLSGALDMVDASRLGRREGRPEPELRSGRPAAAGADASGVTQGDAIGSGLEGQRGHGDDGRGWPEAPRPVASADGRNGSFWSGSEWLLCHDGKARRTEPGIRLLVDGMAGRVPAWRLAGNSISPVLAAEVIGAFLDIERSAA